MALPTQAPADDLRRLDGDVLSMGVLFGCPTVPLERRVRWLASGGPYLRKDPHYEPRDRAH